MSRDHSQKVFNPCCCITLKSGATVIGALDIVYGIGYLGRMMYLDYLHTNYHTFFPADIPTPTSYTIMHEMFHGGNYYVMIFSGIILVIAAVYLRDHFKWLLAACYTWLALRLFLVISFTIFINALFEAEVANFHRLGVEILLCNIGQLYTIPVVCQFIRDSRIELNNKRAINPLIISKREQAEYLSIKPTKFNNAMSFQVLTPHYFLKSSRTEGEGGEVENYLNVDESLLQYVATKSRVEVKNDNRGAKKSRGLLSQVKSTFHRQKEDEEDPFVTLKSFPKRLLVVDDESTSMAPSDMSVSPDEENLPLPQSFMRLPSKTFSNIADMFSMMISQSRAQSASASIKSSFIKPSTSVTSDLEIIDVDAPSSNTSLVEGGREVSQPNINK